MKINGNEIRPGHVIEHRGGLWLAVRVHHVKPGKGGAFAQVELKHVTEGTKLHERFRSSETVERARLEQKPHQFLYAEGERLVFMDMASYEQIEIQADLLGDRAALLRDGMEVLLETHEGRALSVVLPKQVALVVRQAEPVVKGQTAAASYKPVILENGLKMMAPSFISEGETILVDTEEMNYLRRVEET